MPTRWKQTFTCPKCKHSAWREVPHEVFAPEPDPVALGKGGRCTKCGHVGATVTVEGMKPKWADSFSAGGMTMKWIDFAESAARDAYIEAERSRGR